MTSSQSVVSVDDLLNKLINKQTNDLGEKKILDKVDKKFRTITSDAKAHADCLDLLKKILFDEDKFYFINLTNLFDYLKANQTDPTGSDQHSNQIQDSTIDSSVNEQSQSSCSSHKAGKDRCRRNLHKLNEALIKCSNYIKQFESSELDLNDLDNENSAYLIEARHKRRFDRLLKTYRRELSKYPELEDELNLDFALDETKYYEATKTIRRQLRSHLKISNLTGDSVLESQFRESILALDLINMPDYEDVLNAFSEACATCNYDWDERMIDHHARKAFKKIGDVFKKVRRNYDNDLLYSRFDQKIDAKHDPADDDEDLKNKLELNRKIAIENHDNMLNKFVVEQTKKQQDGIGNEDDDDDDDDDDDEDDDDDGEDETADEDGAEEDIENEEDDEDDDEDGDEDFVYDDDDDDDKKEVDEKPDVSMHLESYTVVQRRDEGEDDIIVLSD